MKSRHPGTLRIALVAAVPVALITYWLVANSRAMTRSPRYRLVRKEGDIEVRDYPHLTVVSAPMGGSGMDGSFRKLFRYITGGNEQAEKIAMTTPVLIEAENEGRRMAFILPENVPVQGIPRPTDDSVSVAERKAERLAVMRFHGGRSSVNEAEAIGTLRKWLDARHVATQGEPVVAYYDPPWTPVFLRRNEVMIPVRGL